MSGVLTDVAARLFTAGTIRVTLTEEDAANIMRSAENMYGNYQTNPSGMPLEVKLKNTVRGFVVERAAAQVLGVADHVIKTEINYLDPETYGYDFVWRGLRTEVKSMDEQYAHRSFFSYPIGSSKTVTTEIAADRVDLIVVGHVFSGRHLVYDVEFDWVINPKSFEEHKTVETYTTKSGEPLRCFCFGRNPEHRVTPHSLWKGDQKRDHRRKRVDTSPEGVHRPPGEEESGLPAPALHG